MTELNSFDLFMRNYQDMVFSVATRLLGNETDAQDMAQEVFLKAYTAFDSLRDNPSAGGWLKTVTRNLCLNHLTRYRARWRFFSEMFPDDHEGGNEFELVAPASTDGEAADADRRRLLQTALLKLPDAQRVPLVLFHFEGMSYEEVAASLKISLSKTKTDIHRGREALRKKLLRFRGELEDDSAPGASHRSDEPPRHLFSAAPLFPLMPHACGT